MWESQLGSHTVRSHGARVARTHMHDWLILVLLGCIIVVLNVIHPFYRFVGKDMMSDLKYPLKSNTIPIWFVPVSKLLPFALRKRGNYKNYLWLWAKLPKKKKEISLNITKAPLRLHTSYILNRNCWCHQIFFNLHPSTVINIINNHKSMSYILHLHPSIFASITNSRNISTGWWV